MTEHADIIVQALMDYRLWFIDQGGNEQENKEDEEKVAEIDKAIAYVNQKVLEENS